VVAEFFLERGSIVYICDVDAAALTEAASTSEEATSDRGILHCVKADVSCYEDAQRFFAQIEVEQGHLDVLVNNAGVSGPTAPVDAVDPADWDQTISVNLNGQF